MEQHNALEFDDFLRQALLLANSPAVMGLDCMDCPAPSPAFVARMEQLLRDPFCQAKRQLRPPWAKVMRAAACLLLALSVTLATAMLHPEARAWMGRVLTQWKTYGIDFTFHGAASGSLGIWYPGYLPAGYQLTATDNLSQSTSLTFTSEEGMSIRLTYMMIAQGNAMSIDREHSEHERIRVNGCGADLFRSNTSGKPNYLQWTDEQERVAFMLISEISAEELVLIAESLDLAAIE